MNILPSYIYPFLFYGGIAFIFWAVLNYTNSPDFVRSPVYYERHIRNSNVTVLKYRRHNIKSLKNAIVELENQIDTTRHKVEIIPLSYYEQQYLQNIDGYKEFKSKYSTEDDARYVAIGMHFGLKENPLFTDELKNNSIAQSLFVKVEILKSKLPDSILSDLIDNLIEMKKLQSVNIVEHKLNPSKWDAHVAGITQRSDVEDNIATTIKRIKRSINIRLTYLWNGGKYE